jgi:hypothetical protein
MHNSTRAEPENDLGFVVNNDRDLICCRPRGTQMQAGCGFVRDANGDMTPDGSDPTVGFFEVVNGELQPRLL